MEKKNYNNMYKSKSLKEISEETATAPVEELSKTEVEPTEVEENVIKMELPKPEVEKIEKTGTVTGGLNLNVRKQPSGEIIGSVPSGTKVVIINDRDDWYEISSPVAGFVMKKFVLV